MSKNAKRMQKCKMALQLVPRELDEAPTLWVVMRKVRGSISPHVNVMAASSPGFGWEGRRVCTGWRAAQVQDGTTGEDGKQYIKVSASNLNFLSCLPSLSSSAHTTSHQLGHRGRTAPPQLEKSSHQTPAYMKLKPSGLAC